jgi:hypothetical protein
MRIFLLGLISISILTSCGTAQSSMKQSSELEESSSKGQRATKKVDKADPEM